MRIGWNGMFDRIVNRYNLYERNLYKCFQKDANMVITGTLLPAVRTKMNKAFFHKVYLNYIEVPITTKCSLRCKECSNLIQYYRHGSFFDDKEIVNDIYRLCQAAEKVEMLRILGGEPLLHPHLKDIIEGLLKIKKVNNIQIVTNGTMLFKESMIPVLRNRRISVDISNYGNVSRNYKELIRQLKRNGIQFHTHKELVWTEQGDFAYRNRTQVELEHILKTCKMDCVSILDGNLHLCPRSSNGHDLKIFNADMHDFVDLRTCVTKRELREKLFYLLNRKSIIACNYCDVYKADKLKRCIAGEQIGSRQALDRYDEMNLKNKEKTHEASRMGDGKGLSQKQAPDGRHELPAG